MTQRANRTEKLALRLSRAAKKTLQAAATAEHKSVSEFVLDAALNGAEERLPDRRIFTLEAKDGTLLWPRSMRRRAATDASSGCFASLPSLNLEASREACFIWQCVR